MNKVRHEVINGYKVCGTCKINKEVSEFFKFKNGYRSYCKSCNYKNLKRIRATKEGKEKARVYRIRAYNKPGAKKKKIEYAKKRITSIKAKCVEYKGGCCSVCGYDKCIQALEFHYLDPSTKEKHPSHRGIDRKKSFESLKPELDKCVLVCANCHREAHFG